MASILQMFWLKTSHASVSDFSFHKVIHEIFVLCVCVCVCVCVAVLLFVLKIIIIHETLRMIEITINWASMFHENL